MCTLTYLPYDGNEFILTSNRDIRINRDLDTPLVSRTIGGVELIFPIDPRSRGSWLAIGDSGRAVCLLNGGFVSHTPEPPYRRSRGLVVLDVFLFDNFEDFAENYDFDDIEPFTMIVVEQYPERRLRELRWDGIQHYLKDLPVDKPYIWSSATLYTREMQQQRWGWFENWQKEYPQAVPQDIFSFHHEAGGEDKANRLVMRRPPLFATVSVSQVVSSGSQYYIRHDNIHLQSYCEKNLLLQ